MMTREQRAERKRLNAERNARMLTSQLEAQVALHKNCCPTCGRGVKVNLALTGWVQCEQYGNEQFRKDPTKPSCSWQGFTR